MVELPGNSAMGENPDYYYKRECPDCKGTGVNLDLLLLDDNEECPNCGGTGNIDSRDTEPDGDDIADRKAEEEHFKN